MASDIAKANRSDDRDEWVIEACKIAGLNVPDEIAIIGVDNDQLICDLCSPPLSSIVLNVEKAGYEAAALLDKMMAGEKVTNFEIHIQPTHVVVRQSTGTLAINDLDVVAATGVKKETEVYNPSRVVVFTEENTWTIEGYSDYPFNDTHLTVGNSNRQIDNYATFHNAPGDLDKGGTNIVFVDGHVEILPRVEDLDEGFRLAWPKKGLPY